MSAFQLFLCIVLSELVFFSLAVTAVKTTIFCAANICMVINKQICCGLKAPGPNTANNYVDVDWDPYPAQVEVSVTVEAGFRSDIRDDQWSSPTCSETFTWPATVDDRVYQMYFTDKLGLAYIANNEPIPQKFFIVTDDDRTVDTETDTCPKRSGLSKTINPYYRDPGKPRLNKPNNKIPWEYIESSGPVTSVANAQVGAVNGAANSDLLGIPPIADSGTPGADFMPTDETIDTSLNTIGSTGGDCTGYGCDVDVASFEQYNPNVFNKRGTPMEFRA